MRKSIIFVSAVALLLASCGGKSTTDSMTPEEIVRQTLGSPNKACVDKYLPKTKSKMAEADKLKASGDEEGSKKAESEAVEIFKTEESSYNQQVDSVNAQNSSYDETVARKNNIASHPGAANSSKWKQIQAKVDKHLANAKAAMDNCDAEKAKSELDAAKVLLAEMEQLLGIGGSKSSANSSVYIVKKGDNLWYIAGKQYSNPFMWPIIYWTNQQQIKDPDLIFPKQEFTIVHDSSADEKAKAERLAKTRGPWSLYDNK